MAPAPSEAPTPKVATPKAQDASTSSAAQVDPLEGAQVEDLEDEVRSGPSANWEVAVRSRVLPLLVSRWMAQSLSPLGAEVTGEGPNWKRRDGRATPTSQMHLTRARFPGCTGLLSCRTAYTRNAQPAVR